jgi:hypothetical protein
MMRIRSSLSVLEAKDTGFFDLFGFHQITPYGELYQRGDLKANSYSLA